MSTLALARDFEGLIVAIFVPTTRIFLEATIAFQLLSVDHVDLQQQIADLAGLLIDLRHGQMSIIVTTVEIGSLHLQLTTSRMISLQLESLLMVVEGLV